MDAFGQLLASTGMTVESLGVPAHHEDAIQFDAEVARILQIPRRPECTEELRLALSCHCRTRAIDDSGNPNELFAVQADAIRQVITRRGGFLPMPVGSGKTLPTMLLPGLLGAQRPVLMLPANLREKTKREFAAYRRNWHVRMPELVSYQEMGRPDRASKLDDIRPDLLMLDEAQWTRNLDAAVARRVERYVETYRPVCIVLSGTLITDELLDSHALALWSLGAGAPVPIPRADAERWSSAIKNAGMSSIGEGALAEIPGGVFEWLRGSVGVVSAKGGDCDAALEIYEWHPEVPKQQLDLIEAVAASKMRPDGELLDEWELPDVLCQIVQGFFYVWDPPPPPWWRVPRKDWRMYSRYVLDQRLPHFDSESQIVTALTAARPSTLPPSPNEGRIVLQNWRAVKDKFIPNPVPVWIPPGPEVLKQAADKIKREPGIVWVGHRAAGWGLEQLGVPYYGGATEPETARPIGRPIACSIKAHGEGKNLQAWHHGLVLMPPANAMGWEQLIGRMHRTKQTAELVTYGIINAISYHDRVIEKVQSKARTAGRNAGFAHKLEIATWR